MSIKPDKKKKGGYLRGEDKCLLYCVENCIPATYIKDYFIAMMGLSH